MNKNIEVITPDLWAVNFQWVNLGVVQGLEPMPDYNNPYATLTNDGVMILNRGTECYPIIKKMMVNKIMPHSDEELRTNYENSKKKHDQSDSYVKFYQNLMEWEIERRRVKAEYLKAHEKPLTIKERLRIFLKKRR